MICFDNINSAKAELEAKLSRIRLPYSKVKLISSADLEEVALHDRQKALKISIESSFGNESYIRHELWLPSDWNGMLVGLGNGGYGGTLETNYRLYAKLGYAAVCTDMGTSRLINEDFPKFSLGVLKDYGWRATHVMTIVAKKIVEVFYGKAPIRSYFIGSSAGGLQGFSEAQRFPLDYDGILVGVPSNNALNYHVYNIWLFKNLINPDGTPKFYSKVTEKINDCAVEYFRAKGDGEGGDDFISYPYSNENTVEEFIAYLKERLPELSEDRLSSLREVYNGPRHSRNGAQIFAGLPIGAEIFCNYMMKDIEYKRCGNKWFDPYFGELDKSQHLEFADDYEALLRDIDPHIGAHEPDLSEFMKNGGKIISYSGAADRSGPFGDMLKYYNRVCDRLGGYATVSNFYRHFTLPGKAHGNNGRGANVTFGDEEGLSLLDTLRVWREADKAPEHLVCAHETKNEAGVVSYKFKRRVYPYQADMTEGVDFPKTTDDKFLNIPQYKEKIQSN